MARPARIVGTRLALILPANKVDVTTAEGTGDGQLYVSN